MNTTFLARRIRQLAPGFTDAEVVQLVETLAQKHLDPDEYKALLSEISPRRP